MTDPHVAYTYVSSSWTSSRTLSTISCACLSRSGDCFSNILRKMKSRYCAHSLKQVSRGTYVSTLESIPSPFRRANGSSAGSSARARGNWTWTGSCQSVSDDNDEQMCVTFGQNGMKPCSNISTTLSHETALWWWLVDLCCCTQRRNRDPSSSPFATSTLG